jgi:hypothetical protein
VKEGCDEAHGTGKRGVDQRSRGATAPMAWQAVVSGVK